MSQVLQGRKWICGELRDSEGETERGQRNSMSLLATAATHFPVMLETFGPSVRNDGQPQNWDRSGEKVDIAEKV